MDSRYEDKHTDPFYTSRRWRAVRTQALLRDEYVCQDCLAEYRAGLRALRDINPAVMVHHLTPYQQDPSLGLCLDNLISLCDMHHERRHPERHQGSSCHSSAPAVPRGIRVIKI